MQHFLTFCRVSGITLSSCHLVIISSCHHVIICHLVITCHLVILSSYHVTLVSSRVLTHHLSRKHCWLNISVAMLAKTRTTFLLSTDISIVCDCIYLDAALVGLEV